MHAIGCSATLHDAISTAAHAHSVLRTAVTLLCRMREEGNRPQVSLWNVLSPSEFFDAMADHVDFTDFTFGDHHDASEFLSKMLSVAGGIAPATRELWQPLVQVQSRCTMCGFRNENATHAEFLDISIPREHSFSYARPAASVPRTLLNDCITAFFSGGVDECPQCAAAADDGHAPG
eukprot:gene98-biopygen22537